MCKRLWLVWVVSTIKLREERVTKVKGGTRVEVVLNLLNRGPYCMNCLDIDINMENL